MHSYVIVSYTFCLFVSYHQNRPKSWKLKKKKKENNVFQLLGSEKPMISRSRPHPENQFNGSTHNLNGSTKIALLAITKINQKSNAASGITGVSLGLTWGALGAHLGLTPSHWGLTGVSLGSPWPSGVSLGTLKASRGFRRGLRRRVLKMLCFYTQPARLN